MGSFSSNLSVSIASVLAVVGAFDAFIGGEWDFFVLFVAIGFMLITVWLRHRADRIPTTLRTDLARWLEHQSRMSGEPMEDVMDRALSAYRTGLVSKAGR